MHDVFEWDQSNEEHILDHDLNPEEVEEVFYNNYMFTPAYNIRGEKREGIIGTTDAGRVLTVIFTRRAKRIRVVTARDASDSEKRRFRRR